MREEIVIAGFGGQGIMLAGKLLAYAGMLEGKQVTYFPSYGAEVRGGTANATVIISDEEIPSPVSWQPDVLLALNLPSCQKFGPRLNKNGLLIANSTLIDNIFNRPDLTIIKIPATSMAQGMGSPRSANMIMLAAYLRRRKWLTLKNVEKGLAVLFSEKKEFQEVNKKALCLGYKYDELA